MTPEHLQKAMVIRQMNRQKITAMFLLMLSRAEIRGTAKRHHISNFITLRSEQITGTGFCEHFD
jgi:hypothetical protein